MNTNPVDVKVRDRGANATSLLIKARDIVIQTEFSELASCEFPIWTSAPVPVEIPPDGAKSFVVGAFSGSVTEKALSGDLPNIIKFPVYKQLRVATRQAYDELTSIDGVPVLARVPLAALATEVSGVVDGRLVQTHCVLPLWKDGSAVLVRLDWSEGEPAEGTPNPEWHMKASTGMPVSVGLEQLEKASRLPATATRCRYQIHVTPWLLGAELLADKGQETPHEVWQRAWQFDDFAEFSSALSRITAGFLGSGPSDPQRAA
ncbi:MAG TPA: hypothetical protein PKJ99_02500 [Thermoanaerobaculales bacterium]|nr:hypothetical protein [Thermoanaerobaculales bacterium]HPA82222.1 hypothetical protein [Thermoanaerobaculales bacterium]HQN97738.1 hypothetical protein [Thermoanaerobaculales bacterium]